MCITRSEIAAPAMVTTMNVERAHCLLGHQSEELTRRSAHHLGWTLTKGSLKPYLPCTIGKAKQKNTVKNSDHQLSSKPGERIFTDIASVQPKNGETTRTPHWCIKVDEKTQFKTSTFHKQKNDMVEPSCELFFRWKQGGNPVSFIRCDNAGENMTLQKRVNSVDWKLNIAFEFTPRDTPQHNHLAELGLASIANKGRALMSAANVPLKIRYKVWTMAFQHATDLDGLIVITIGRRTATRYEHWCGQLPRWVNHLRTWGEAVTVKIKTDTTPKIADRGIQCMFVGHAKEHDGDCYAMWYAKTNKIYWSRDVIWLRKMYYPTTVPGENTLPITLEVDMNETANNEHDMEDNDEDLPLENIPQTNTAQLESRGGTTRSGARYQDIAAANIAMNPVTVTEAEIKFMEYMKTTSEIACVGAGLGGGFDHTSELHVMKYADAMRTPDVKKWSMAVYEEYKRMEDNEVWIPVSKADVPADAIILSSTWQ
jgi:hypothetical protein